MIKYIFIPFFLIYILFDVNAQKINEKNGVTQVNSSEFKELIKNKNATFIDVRTNSEYSAEHIENAGQLNYYALDFKKKLLLLPKNQPIYLYCNTGYRSQRAGEILIKSGYKNVYNLEHGIMEWNLKELPVVEGDKSLLNKENAMSVDDFKKLIASDTLVFIDFYAPWCGPCRKMMPMIDSLKTEYHGKVKIVKVNSDVSKKLVKELKLIGVPYLVLYKSNKLLFEKSGFATREELVNEFKK
ncbi:MAG: thioredoxin domain-containing protein [Bacteroidales bacterium]|nr:thioredoxin domain-containing protein [Bacteroidales bacterium]